MSNHSVPVVRINEVLPHKNAEKLEIIPVFNFQIVAQKGQFKVGDLAIFVPPDSVVPDVQAFRFVWQDRTWPDGVPEKYRRVTVRRFRGEYSEGLLMPISLAHSIPSGKHLVEGDDCAERIGVEHWNPPDPDEPKVRTGTRQSRTRPKSLKGWFYFGLYWTARIFSFGFYNPYGNTGGSNEKQPYNAPPIYDVENLKRYGHTFVDGEDVVVSEKIHGSNARYLYQEDSYFFKTGKMFAGSRQFWKAPGSNNIWRKVLETTPDLERWCHDNPGYTLYGEVVPTQKGFNYGHTTDRPHLFIFDILDRQGKWVDYDTARGLTGSYDLEWCPLLYRGPYDAAKIQGLVDGPTKTGGDHIREGVVIKTVPEREVRGLGRAQLKLISNRYLEKEQ